MTIVDKQTLYTQNPYIFGFLFLLSILFCVVLNTEATENHENTIYYIGKSKNKNDFSATLIPHPSPGRVLNNKSLYSVRADKKKIPFNIVHSSDGQAQITGNFSGLTEGKHKGTIQTHKPSGGVLDEKDILFIVDRTPPEITLVAPAQPSDLPLIPSYISFKIIDDGSGVAEDNAANRLAVTARGASVEGSFFQWRNNVLYLLVVLKNEYSLYSLKKYVHLVINLQDRAGNVGKYQGKFQVRQNEVLIKKRKCECDLAGKIFRTRLKYSLVSFVDPQALLIGDTFSASLNVDWGFIYNENDGWIFGKVYEPVGANFRFFHTGLTKFRNSINEQITVTSDSNYISVDRIIDQKSSNIKVVVKQTQVAPAGEQIAYITIAVPKSLALNLSGKRCNYLCNLYGYGKKGVGWIDEQYREQSELTTSTLRIPVFLKTKSPDITEHIIQKENTLIYQLGGPDWHLIDTKMSWFDVDGKKYWFKKSPSGLEAKASVIEGKVALRVATSLNSLQYDQHGSNQCQVINNGRTSVCKSFYNVVMDVPIISQMKYNRTSNTLSASVSDVGTPLEKLSIQFTVDDRPVGYTFSPETGVFRAQFTPQINAISWASLKITDLAGQYAIKKIPLLGEILKTKETIDNKTPTSTQSGESPNTLKTKNSADFVLDYEENKIDRFAGYRSFNRSACGKKLLPAMTNLGYAGNGKITRRVCHTYKKPGICYNGKFYSLGDNPYKQFFLDLNQNKRSDRLLEGESIEFGSDKLQQWSSGPATASFQKCTFRTFDVQPPVISIQSFEPETGVLIAYIHDHGNPVTNLDISFGANSMLEGNYGYNHSLGSMPFTFTPSKNTLSGTFEGKFSFPHEGEKFSLSISAWDKDHNYNSAFLEIERPRNPPDLSLKIIDIAKDNHFLHSSIQSKNVNIIGKARDESGIDRSSIVFTMDNQKMPPVSLTYSDATWDAKGQDKRYLVPYRSYVYDYAGMWATLLSEGAHKCTLTATDSVGLSAQTSLEFSITFRPVIYQFTHQPPVLQQLGGPAFTASIVDQGGDLSVTGISLTIDNQAVDSSTLFYDSETGYFSADGPLKLNNGTHLATLAATDNHGHTVKENLYFVTGGTTDQREDLANLQIDEIFLWETQHQNNDGLANPGEYIRLFISLLNTSTEQLTQCEGKLRSEDNRIVIETSQINYDNLVPHSANMPLHGFDLRIDKDILKTTISSPYEIHFNLLVECENHTSWTIPLIFPIYEPSIPIDISSTVKVKLDYLPHSTSKGEIEISGTATSSHSFIDQVTIFVNGEETEHLYFNKEDGTFKGTVVLQDGSNVIEVHALDQSGALGLGRAVIFCQSKVIVLLNTLPSKTTKRTLYVTGSVKSTAGIVKQLTLTVNGKAVKNIQWRTGKERFGVNIPLELGRNVIIVEAIDSFNRSGIDQAYTQRISAIKLKPSIEILSIQNGEVFGPTSPFPEFIDGRFQVGDSTLQSIVFSTEWGRMCTVHNSSHLWEGSCGDAPTTPGNYLLTVTLRTTDGQTASHHILIRVLSMTE